MLNKHLRLDFDSMTNYYNYDTSTFYLTTIFIFKS